MIIAIDYDNTYTAAPDLWNQTIKLFQDAGHTIICVTARDDTPVMAQPVLDSIGKLVPVIFANGRWKRDVAKRNGYKVDVWIDDMPEMIAAPLLIGKP